VSFRWRTLAGSAAFAVVARARIGHARLSLVIHVGPGESGICILGNLNNFTPVTGVTVKGFLVKGFLVKGFDTFGDFGLLSNDLTIANNTAEDNRATGSRASSAPAGRMSGTPPPAAARRASTRAIPRTPTPS
jgi:hypothetical protein